MIHVVQTVFPTLPGKPMLVGTKWALTGQFGWYRETPLSSHIGREFFINIWR